MNDVIRLRDPRWSQEEMIKHVLEGIQTIEKTRDILQTYALDVIEDFVLALFPIEETAAKNGSMTGEYEKFLNGIKDYSIDEFYEKVMKGR